MAKDNLTILILKCTELIVFLLKTHSIQYSIICFIIYLCLRCFCAVVHRVHSHVPYIPTTLSTVRVYNLYHMQPYTLVLSQVYPPYKTHPVPASLYHYLQAILQKIHRSDLGSVKLFGMRNRIKLI